ncbi:3-ketoacyl-ACP reductase [Cognatishimia sp. WU-CL00825]|uniref:3-ketoacyl-ACP reductase n=1 Tax=Cognatishimia sp. WU-CL00825 TaxID=3127658 RepID=UPI00310B45C6
MTGVALITGGQKGIGLGVAQALVSAGWHVALAASSDANSDGAQTALETLGPQARYYQHDMRHIDGISALLDQIETAQGPVRSLISNAGVSVRKRGDLLDVAPADYDHTVDINLRGGFFLAQAVARRMLAQPSQSYRSLVFVTSVSAQMVSIERAEYCISKAGASMMAQLFAARLAAEDIGVFEVRPGLTETAMTAGSKDAFSKRIDAGLVPAARWGQPSDIANCVLPLVSGQMKFANGAVIPADGGLSINRL